MNLIDTFLAAKGSTLVSELTSSGFSMEQAQKFLPEAGQQLIKSLQSGNVDLMKVATDENTLSSMLDGIDIASLASRFGVNEEAVRGGLMTTIPVLVDFLKKNGGALASGLISGLKGNSGGLAGMAKGLLG